MMKKKLMTMAEVAAMLGVDRRQVWAWYTRRERNGFPEPVQHRPLGVEGRTRPMWNPTEVKAWHRKYTPNVGGRPKGVPAKAAS